MQGESRFVVDGGTGGGGFGKDGNLGIPPNAPKKIHVFFRIFFFGASNLPQIYTDEGGFSKKSSPGRAQRMFAKKI